MSVVALKLVLTPALIAFASLAGRRWGPALSGWLVGLPFTSAPVAFFLALDHGVGFASSAAAGILAGTLSQIAFCLSYGWLACRWTWLRTLLAGCAVFACATAALRPWSPSPGLVYGVVVVLLVAALRLMPRGVPGPPADAVPPPRWDIPVRMVVTTLLVLLLTGLAPALGPRLAGLLTPFPLYAATLAIFAHHQQGPGAAIRVLRGLLFGLFGFAGFFLVLALLLGPLGIAAAFLLALTVALACQAASLRLVQPAQRTPASSATP